MKQSHAIGPQMGSVKCEIEPSLGRLKRVTESRSGHIFHVTHLQSNLVFHATQPRSVHTQIPIPFGFCWPLYLNYNFSSMNIQ